MLEGFRARVREAMVKSDGKGEERDVRVDVIVPTRAIVDVPMTRTDEPREMGVEEIVTTAASGVKVMPLWRTILAPGDGRVKVCPAIV